MSSMTEAFLARLAEHAIRRPAATALQAGDRRLDYATLLDEIDRRRTRLSATRARRVGLALDNGLEWALWDLALLAEPRVAVPVPTFFHPHQRRHLVDAAGLDAWIGPDADSLGFTLLQDAAIATRRVIDPPALHEGTTRLTFTSGTSAAPKGVCLDNRAILGVVLSLAEALAPVTIERHLAMLPLATLLENLGGLYLPLWLGATAILPGCAELGWRGANGFDASTALDAVRAYRPHSLILVPQQLQALVEATPSAPDGLRLVAVGGARLAEPLRERALAEGWPVIEGYGLSEAASVVCLNRPGESPHGVGRPLNHARVRLSAQGEVEVAGTLMLGYLGQPPRHGWHATGDLGRWAGDALILEGRRREVFITAYGRNVDPQWPESVLCARPGIAQALVHGEALAHNRALIVPATPEVSDTDLAADIARANAHLPDYARIGEWRRTAPFTTHNRQATANGRLRRSVILASYRDWLCRDIPHRRDPMSAYQRLQDATRSERDWLLATPLLRRAVRGEVGRDEYLAFLGQAYHHVRFTVPLMMACGARLPERHDWLRAALVEYITEEQGHEQWILDDIRATGGDPERAMATPPDPATALMVAYVRDRIEYGNPLAFFGMVQVLEGTSTALASRAAEALQASLELPDEGVRYLRSHGSLDVGHLAFFESLIERLDDTDLEAVIEAARLVYRLYGAMFRGITARCQGRDAARELTDALA